MSTRPYRYQSPDEDSHRWRGFPFRDGDIVISTRSKSGTTWMQQICLMFALETADLPAGLGELSPWLDWLTRPLDEVVDLLEAQRHRRVIKTHTPLDGLPSDPRVKYIVVGRHPLDAAVSLYHQSDNIDHDRMRELTGVPTPPRTTPRPPVRDWLLSWIAREAEPRDALDTLPGFCWHATDAWQRRESGNVLLAHYDQLLGDLGGQMRQIADWLDVTIDAATWPRMVEAASFANMRQRAARHVPTQQGVLKDPAEFFRRGRSGAGADLLSASELRDYHARAARLAPDPVVRWLHQTG